MSENREYKENKEYSENKEYKRKHGKAEEAVAVPEDRENAPRAQEAESVPAAEKKGGKKKSAKGRMSVRLAALMLAVALLFGIVAGYAVGRSRSEERLLAAEARIEELTQAAEEAGREEIDVFTDEISAENRAALADLSGMSMQIGGEDNVFLDQESLDDPDPADDDGTIAVGESAETDPVVAVEYNGGQIMSDEVSVRYSEELASYVFSGYTEEEVSASVLNEVMQDMVLERVLLAQAQKLGEYELTSADEAQIDAQAQATLEERLEQCRSFVYTEGMSEAETTEAAAAFLKETEGLDLEAIRADLADSWWKQKLRDAVVKSVEVDSAAILDAYNERLSDQRERFSADHAAFESAHINGEAILYNLSGYRAVKLLKLEGDDAANAEDIRAQLVAGASFDEYLDQYGKDEGMKTAALRDSGYYISESTATLPETVVTAAQSLSHSGDISPVISTEDGAYILYYVGPVAAGDVDMAQVYDDVAASALAAAQDIAYDAQLTAWLEEADAKYYPERMQ